MGSFEGNSREVLFSLLPVQSNTASHRTDTNKDHHSLGKIPYWQLFPQKSIAQKHYAPKLSADVLSGHFYSCSQISKLIFISEKVKLKSLSHVRLFATPWTVAYQAPLSMGFSRQEYRSGCHFLLQLPELGAIKSISFSPYSGNIPTGQVYTQRLLKHQDAVQACTAHRHH